MLKFNSLIDLEDELEKYDSDYEEVMEAVKLLFEYMDCDDCINKSSCKIKDLVGDYDKFYCYRYTKE